MDKDEIVAVLVFMVILIVVFLIQGCVSGQIEHVDFRGNEVVSRTRLDYWRIGGQRLQGLTGEAPNGWRISLEQQKSQKIEIGRLVDMLARAIALAEQGEIGDEPSTTEE